MIGLLFLASTAAAFQATLEERVSDALQDAIVERIGDADSLEIEVLHLGIRAKSDCGDSPKLDITLSSTEDFQGPLDAYAEVFDSKGLCESWRFNPHVAIWKLLPTAASSVAAGDIVEASLNRGRFDQVQGSLIEPSMGPWVALTALQRGEPLTMDRLKRKPLNADGDEVLLLVTTGTLRITAKGRLMSDAYIGQQVRVLSLTTNTVVEGMLTKYGTVQIGGNP
jgi:flagella basal body P-ring formation protein FlgA